MTNNISFDNHQIPTYSNLMNWFNSLDMHSAPAHQWISTIKSLNAIRGEEVQRSEILDYLLGLNEQDKVLKNNLILVVQLGLFKCDINLLTECSTVYRPALQTKAFTPELIPKIILDSFADNEVIGCFKLSSFAFKIVGLRFTGIFGVGEGWFVFDDRWQQFKPSKSYGNVLEAVDFLYTVATDKFSQYYSRTPRNHYERFSLLGKKLSYKEWIVSLPDWPASFDNGHFSVENTILHLRTSEWIDASGKPLLLVDEIQSDWHAQGRSNGYLRNDEISQNNETDAVPDAPFKKEWHELGIKIATWIALQSGHHRIAFNTAHTHSSRYESDSERFHLLYDQLIPKALEKLASKFKCLLVESTIITSQPKHRLKKLGSSGWEMRARIDDELPTLIKNETVAMRYLRSRGSKKLEKVKVFEISTSLAAIVKNKGLPLFGWW